MKPNLDAVRRFAFFLLFCCYPLLFPGMVPVAGQLPGQALVRSFAAQPNLRGASAGVYVSDGTTGKVLAELNADKLLAPASVLKLFSSASALEILGPDYRFRTLLGYAGRAEGGVLKGNLTVVGGGDPTLGSVWFPERMSPGQLFSHWAGKLRSAGIGMVEGNLLIDVSSYRNFDVPGSWAWEDIGNYYGAAPSGLLFSDNMVRLTFSSPPKAGEPALLLEARPPMPGIEWISEVTTSSDNRDNAYVYGSPWDSRRVVRGTIPAGRGTFEVKAAMPDPPLHFGKMLKDALAGNGISLAGSVLIETARDGFIPVDTVESPALSELVRLVNHESVNLFADQLVMQTGLEKCGAGSIAAGLEYMVSYWQGKGLIAPILIEDGSGLSRFNAASARSLAFVLHHMRRSRAGRSFRESLPTAGKGTLALFPVSQFPGETLRCKSGSMKRVRCYAGYLRCDSGRDLDFAILVNNFSCSQQQMLREIQDLLLGFKKKL